MTFEECQSIVGHIAYRGWKFRLTKKGDGFLLQVSFLGPDAKTGYHEIQKGRKWYVSSHSCVGEVVRTAYKAIEAAEEHERDEHFTYRGAAIYDPHRDVDQVAMLEKESFFKVNVRAPRSSAV